MFNQPQLVPTIVIVADLHDNLRGYSLIGREFFVKGHCPRHTKVVTLDECVIEDSFWVVSLEEYLRVVPEARSAVFNSDEIFIPIYVARSSFRPKYLQHTPLY